MFTSGAQVDTQSRLVFRVATEVDRENLLHLAEVVFAQTGTDKKSELGPAFWDWQYARSSTGLIGIWIAELEQEVLGQFPTNIVRVQWGNRELPAALPIDAMVHPEHRNKSLFVRLGREAIAGMTAAGIALSFGFPNQNSFPGATRFLGYKHICNIPLLVRPLRWRALLKQKIPAGLGTISAGLAKAAYSVATLRLPRLRRDVQVRVAHDFPGAVDQLWREASQEHHILTVRDRRYLRWRYCQCPTRRYTIYLAEKYGRLLGYLVQRRIRSRGHDLGAVVDLLTLPGCTDVQDALLAAAEKDFRDGATEAAVCIAQPHTSYYRALLRNGYVRVPERYNPRSFKFVCQLHRGDLPEPELHDPARWHVTLGDYDVY